MPPSQADGDVPMIKEILNSERLAIAAMVAMFLAVVLS